MIREMREGEEKTPYLWGIKRSISLDVSQTRPVHPSEINNKDISF
jgi:hypothetical protein